MIDSACGAKMLNQLLLIALLCCAAASPAISQQLTITSAPKSLDFQSSDAVLPTSALPELCAAALGAPVTGSADWSALRIADPFATPSLVFALVVAGAPAALKLTPAVATYQLSSADGVAAALDGLQERVRAQHIDLTQTPVKLAKPTAEQKFAALKPQSNAAERKFVEQVAALSAVAARVAAGDEPTFVSAHIDASGLAGASEAAQQEARKLLQQAVKELTAELEKRSAGALVAVVETSEQQPSVVKRQKRQATGTPTATDNTDDWNLAVDYNEDYPVIFNIILWFGVIMAFSLLAISYAIGGMDPGRDSIIYRMTSTRIKKDN